MIKYENVSALFGPTCIESRCISQILFICLNLGAQLVSALASFSKIPVFLWSTVNADFINRIKYPTVISAAGTVSGLVTATINVLKQYNWTQIAFLYTREDGNMAEHVPSCEFYADTVQVTSIQLQTHF